MLYCHAGCCTKDILTEIGLVYSDIDTNITPEDVRPKWQTYIEKIMPGYAVTARYDYKDEQGKYLYSNIRLANNEGKKTFRQGIIQGDRIKLGLNDVEKTLYNLPTILKTIREYKDRFPIFIVEGEKDVETMKRLGLFNTTTAGGAKGWRETYARYFIGADVVILPDNDEAGRELVRTVTKSIKPFASRITVCNVSDKSKGDITDYIEGGHTKEDLFSLIKSAHSNIKGYYEIEGMQDYTEYPDWFNVSVKVNEKDGKVTIRKEVNVDNLSCAVSKSLSYIKVRNELSNDDALYIYKNGVYKPFNENAIKEYIRRFIPQGMAKNHTLKEVYNLLMCSDSRITSYSELNSDERYINLKNGLYDVAANKFLPHTPDVISTIQYNCNYSEKATAPTFLKYIDNLCTDTDGVIDEQERDLLQEWIGLILSNIPVYRVKKCLVLYSLAGDTGKSQLVEILSYIIGQDYVSNLDLQTLGSQDDRFSTGFLYGKRMNINGDQKHTEIQNLSTFKMLTGGDRLKAEPKGKQAFSFKYTGGLMFSCNDLPTFSDDKGKHVYDRFSVIPCENVISKEKRDRNLIDKFKNETDGIFTWGLQGLQRLIENGYNFTECERSQEVMNEFVDKIDSVSQYLRLYCVITDNEADKIRKTELENNYTAFMTNNGRQPVNKNNLRERLVKNGVVYKNRYHGYPCYVKIKPREKYLIDIEGIDALYLPDIF